MHLCVAGRLPLEIDVDLKAAPALVQSIVADIKHVDAARRRYGRDPTVGPT